MSTKKEAKKPVEAKPPAHEVAIALLEENPQLHIGTIACIYSQGAKVPEEAINDVVHALEEAHGKIHPTVIIYFDDAIKALHRQREGSGN